MGWTPATGSEDCVKAQGLGTLRLHICIEPGSVVWQAVAFEIKPQSAGVAIRVKGKKCCLKCTGRQRWCDDVYVYVEHQQTGQ